METVLPFVFIFSLGVSFMLSGLEAGLFSLSRWRIRHQMRQGNHRAELLYGYLEHPENFLWTILVGNSLANLVVFSALVFWFYQWLGPWPALLIVSLAAAVLLFYAIFELLPKTIFRAFPNRFCMWMAVPFRFLYILFRPVVALLVAIAGNFPRGAGEARIFGHLFRSREEMRWVMQESAPGLTPEERAMVNRVLDLRNLSVGQIAVPMDKVAAVTTDTPVPEVLRLARERGFTRLPVWRNHEMRRHVAGMVSLRTLLYEERADESKRAEDYMKTAIFLESDMRLETALRQLQRTGQQLAVVIGPNQKETGVVSLQDILRAIFGDVTL
jgi:putative hemolysin